MTNMSIKTLLFAGVATFGLCAGAQAQTQLNAASQTAANFVGSQQTSNAGGGLLNGNNANIAVNYADQSNRYYPGYAPKGYDSKGHGSYGGYSSSPVQINAA